MKSALFERRKWRLLGVPAGDPRAPYLPSITSCTPSSGAAGASLVIVGDNFLNVTAVTLGGSAVGSLVVVGSKKITCTAPSGAGTVSLVVTTTAGTATLSNAFTFLALAPTVTGVAASAGPAAGGTSVTVTGTNFTGATAVTFGGNAATGVTVVNSTTITCTTPSHAAGAVTVAVTTPSGTGSLGSAFTYVAAPTVTGVSPNAGPTAGGQSVTITGTNFTGATAVTFGGNAATGVTVVNSTTITCTTPSGSAGSPAVAVTTVGGTGSNSSVYTYAAAPSISSLNYSQGDPGGGGQSIVITGSNLSSASAVSFGGTSATITGNTSTTVTVTLPAKTAGTTTVSITTPGGTSGTLAFEFWSPAQLALTMWHRASYSGAPWGGTSSAGASGGRSLVSTGTPPTSGSAVGGFNPATATASQQLENNTQTWANLVSASAYTIAVLMNPSSASAPGAAPYNDPAILADASGTAYIGVGFNTSGFTPYHRASGVYDGVSAAMSTGTWSLGTATYDGTNLVAQVNNNTAQTLAKGNVDAGASNIRFNESPLSAGSGGVPCSYLEVLATDSAISAGNRTKLRLYCNQRYGVSV